MEVNLSQFKKNIISWYPIEKGQSVLEIGNDDEIVKELKEKTEKNSSISVEDILNQKNNNEKYDYVVLIGIFEKLSNKQEIIKVLEFSKKALKENGKILLAMKNKFGMKYWAGDNIQKGEKPYISIIDSKENLLGLTQIKNILNALELKYKFYYPLPDYEITNVIFTNEFMPDNESIDARDLTFCNDDSTLFFSERDAYKQILNTDKDKFPFFANSFFIEITNDENFEDINFVSFGITRKKDYRIRTIIKKDVVYKYANDKNDLKHIEKTANNIKTLKSSGIEVLGEYKNERIECEFLKNATSLDKVLLDVYYKEGFDKAIEKIKEFKKEILGKLLVENAKGNDIFDKYNIEIPEDLKEKLHFTKNGILDLIFQNCLVKDNKIYAYDQEWSEENVPVEFILYRAVIYFIELKNEEGTDKILEILDLKQYSKYFDILENKFQDEIVDKQIWELHSKCVSSVGNSKSVLDTYKERLDTASEHIENLENKVQEQEKGINDLTNLIQEKDVQLVNYANELRAISNSLSWKITKPLRKFVSLIRKILKK